MQFAVIAFNERRAGQGLDLPGIQALATTARDLVHERVEDVGDREDLLLADTEEIIIKSGPLDDRLRRVRQAGRRIDHHRGIAGTGHHRPSLAAESRAGHRRAAGHDQEPNAVVLEQRIGRFERRRVDDREEVVEAGRLADRLVEASDPFGGDLRAGGMSIEDDRVASGEHVDRIASESRQAVRHGSNRADDAERSVIRERQSAVAGKVFGP